MIMQERIGVRVDSYNAERIALAAEYESKSVSGFVRESAIAAADRVLTEVAWGMTLEETMEIFDQAERMTRR